jgi:hypothetical protein
MRHAHDTVRLEQIRHGQTGIVAPVPNSALAARRARSLLSLSSVSNAMTGAHAMPRLSAFAILSLKRSLARAAASALSSPNVGTCTAASTGTPTPATHTCFCTFPKYVSSVFVCATLAAGPPPRQSFSPIFFERMKFQYYVQD